jgi:hypothetical protein
MLLQELIENVKTSVENTQKSLSDCSDVTFRPKNTSLSHISNRTERHLLRFSYSALYSIPLARRQNEQERNRTFFATRTSDVTDIDRLFSHCRQATAALLHTYALWISSEINSTFPCLTDFYRINSLPKKCTVLNFKIHTREPSTNG